MHPVHSLLISSLFALRSGASPCTQAAEPQRVKAWEERSIGSNIVLLYISAFDLIIWHLRCITIYIYCLINPCPRFPFSAIGSMGSDKLDKRWLDNRANFSIIDNRPLITIIIELRPWQYYRATTGPMRYIYRPHITFFFTTAEFRFSKGGIRPINIAH
jgi:hypothetical protein